jgi:hypothetical protein
MGAVLEEFDALLHQAVADRLPVGDHPAVLQLSGGLDSGAIACAAVRVRGGPIGLPALTVGYERLFADPEPALATRAAAALGLDHRVLYADDWVEPIPGMAKQLPQACGSWSGWPLSPGYDGADVDMPPVARRGRVTLTGWDGDAVLYSDAPGALAQLARRGRLIQLGTSIGVLAGASLACRRLPRMGLRGALKRLVSRGAIDSPVAYPTRWLDPAYEARHNLPEHWQSVMVPTSGVPTDPRRRAIASLSSAAWSGLFEGQDPGFTGQLVEARHPLLDLRMVRFALTLPVIPWCVEKGVLRAWLRTRLPPQIWRRPKQGLQGDPIVLTLRERAATPRGRAELAAHFVPPPQDPLDECRLLRSDWRQMFLRALEADHADSMLPYRALQAHAVGRWLRRVRIGSP